MDTFLQATVMSFREGLEGFLIVTILLKFLDKTDNSHLKKTSLARCFCRHSYLRHFRADFNGRIFLSRRTKNNGQIMGKCRRHYCRHVSHDFCYLDDTTRQQNKGSY